MLPRSFMFALAWATIAGCITASDELIPPADTTPPNASRDSRFGLFYVEKNKAALEDLGVTTTRNILHFSHLRRLAESSAVQDLEYLPSIIPRSGAWENTAVKELSSREMLWSAAHFAYCGYPADMNAFLDELLALLERFDGDGIDDLPGLRYPVTAIGLLNEPHIEWLGHISQSDLDGIDSVDDIQAWRKGRADQLKTSLWEFVRLTSQAIKKEHPDIEIVIHASMLNEGLPELNPDVYLDSFDAIDVHFYGNHDEFDTKLTKVDAAVNAIDTTAGKSIVTFEMGGPSKHELFASDADFAEHAELAIKLHLVGLSHGLSKFFYVSLAPLGGFDTPIYYNLSLLDENGNRKPAYYSYKALLKRVMGFSQVTRLNSPQHHYKLEFEDRKPLFVVWSDDGDAVIDLSSYVDEETVTATWVSTARTTVDEREITRTFPSDEIPVSSNPAFIE